MKEEVGNTIDLLCVMARKTIFYFCRRNLFDVSVGQRQMDRTGPIPNCLQIDSSKITVIACVDSRGSLGTCFHFHVLT